MKAKAAQYLNELVSLTIMSLMVVALIAGQASAESRALAMDRMDRLQEPGAVRFVIDTEVDNLASPIAEAILGEAASLNGRLTLEVVPQKGDRGLNR